MQISDPRFAAQWHFPLIGDINTIWDDYTGRDIHVAVYDDGIEQSHAELSANYHAALHYDGLNGAGADNGQPNGSDDGHGTAVAGIIAAAHNGQGGVGVAFDGALTSVDFLGDVQFESSAIYYDALRHAAAFDVMNNSWGSTPNYRSYGDIGDASGWGPSSRAAFEYVTEYGRDGRGTIIVKAAGNEAHSSSYAEIGVLGNASGDGRNNLQDLVVVAATDSAGAVASYSNWGPSILIAAPAAAVTTDRSGSAGYAWGDSTSSFGGTSAATPVVSGVTALMLDANPRLGWRDVQTILANSAAHTGSGYGTAGTGYEIGTWDSNDAANWNGGGLSFHASYGFGMVDAYAAVRMAEVWDRFHSDAATSANQHRLVADYSGSARSIPDQGQTSLRLDVSGNIQIEHIYAEVNFSHSRPSDLTLELISPAGTAITLFDGEMNSGFDGDWTFGVTAAMGMQSAGQWTLRATDSLGGANGLLRDARLEFLGRAATPDSVYHFTDDFQDYAQRDAARRSLSDTDGGYDWLNLAALSGDVAVTLATGGQLSVDGTAWTTLTNGAALEAVQLGDGADHLVGSGQANLLYGGRGADYLHGGAHHDQIYGETGDDRLNGGTGSDSLFGGRGDDVMFGGRGGDTLIGSAGHDILHGEELSGSWDDALAQIFRLYQATLGRAPDAIGHMHWANALHAGQITLADAAEAFASSAEFLGRYPSSAPADFVTLLYQNALGRSPDDGGLSRWSGELSSGSMSRAEVIIGFSESAEFQTRSSHAAMLHSAAGYLRDWAEPVFRLYQATLDRLPDFEGLRNWASALAEGRSLDSVTRSFVDSAEFQARYGATNDGEFVTLLYQNVLERQPDATGQQNWTERLATGAMSREDVVRGFADSAEFIAQSAPRYQAYIAAQTGGDRLDGGSGTNILFGGWLADTFYFDDERTALDTVVDLEAWDRIELDNFNLASARAAQDALVQSGNDVVLAGANTEITFANTTLSDFSDDMFILT
ncbi:DUF4214 domain-containing protein [Cognatishimia sp. SS12]|uniref:DUF4214 domain-containing protein n=1 Tax=Cognatishimia sp. SS12 TaxID=2979465 RepID=UPI00232DD19E|nr:DUF4214 domain-containing protein [Cognatishimia sp. SS12]MDC0739524.1 DUF4214 domain-containing protein [Cognatishimia sp. SS12]